MPVARPFALPARLLDRAPRQLRITRPGWFYLALTVGMGIAGLNTSNNLIFLTCGLMLGVVVASGILSERCLRGLDVERRAPRSATAGKPALVGLVIRNAKRSASFGLLVEDLATGGRCHFPLVRACESEARTYEWTPARRGRVALDSIRVATRFPFGLFEKSLRLHRLAELLIHPSPLECEISAAGFDLPSGDSPAAGVGEGQDFWQLRPYRDGEDARTIAWAPTARAGRLVALDRERYARRRERIELPERATATAFEIEVGRAAFRAAALLDRGFAISLNRGAEALVPEGHGDGQLARILDVLAGVEVRS